MKRGVWIAGLALPLLGVAVAVVALRPQRQWTSDSADAIAELNRGLQAEMKLYKNEAAAHYEKALELDPSFVTAKLMLVGAMQTKDKQAIEKLLADVRSTDLDRLSAGEQFLIRYNLAKFDRKPAEAARVIEAHLAAHPDDAFALFSRCTDLWLQPDWEAAERCNRRLLEVDPNWVLAYNYLGYIAMAQGRFSDAEKNFLAYKYIAPDQANPHDSLGELYTLLGRYEEATAEFDEALRVRPDFCASYEHLLLVANLKGDPVMAGAVIARAEASGQCHEKVIASMRCTAALWKHFLVSDWEGAWRVAEEGCLDRVGDLSILIHRAAMLCGRLAEAEALEEKPRKYLKGAAVASESASGEVQAGLAHMEGVRQLAQGDAAAAVALLDNADRKLAFRGEGQGVFKLLNQLALAEALRAAGLQERATAVVAAVAEVNPRLAELFGERGALRIAGAGAKAAVRSRP
jgi:tetratricopeptide (TPR) repeat protein